MIWYSVVIAVFGDETRLHWPLSYQHHAEVEGCLPACGQGIAQTGADVANSGFQISPSSPTPCPPTPSAILDPLCKHIATIVILHEQIGITLV